MKKFDRNVIIVAIVSLMVLSYLNHDEEQIIKYDEKVSQKG